MKYAWLSTSRCRGGVKNVEYPHRKGHSRVRRTRMARGMMEESNLRVTAIIRSSSPPPKSIPKALAGIIKVSRCCRYNSPTSRSPKRAFERRSMGLRLGFAKIDMSPAQSVKVVHLSQLIPFRDFDWRRERGGKIDAASLLFFYYYFIIFLIFYFIFIFNSFFILLNFHSRIYKFLFTYIHVSRELLHHIYYETYTVWF